MKKIKLHQINKIHMIGIGGIGMSALAHMFLASGKTITANDIEKIPTHLPLIEKGMSIPIGDQIELIPPDTQLIIYSIAWNTISPALMTAVRQSSIPLFTYAEALGLATQEYTTIAVAGTHGKTTTTAMIAKMMVDARLDPTVIAGGIMSDYNSNYRGGSSEYLVTEACEYQRNFLSLEPDILAITNIDLDHLDYYHDLGDIQDAFHHLAKKVPHHGFIICDENHQHVAPVLKHIHANIVDYRKQSVQQLSLRVPSAYNILNAQVALALAEVLDIDRNHAYNSLRDYAGTKRRFEYIGTTPQGIPVYDDYAHHPAEISAFLLGARKILPGKKLIAVFQPHLYSRTKKLLDEFARSFGDADQVFVLAIYPAREEPDPEISSQMLVEEINKVSNNATFNDSFDGVINSLREYRDPDAVILTIGAGQTDKIARSLIE